MEPIEVDARWDPQGRMIPLRFTWKGCTYAVESTGRRWQEAQNEHLLCMVSGGAVYELVYDLIHKEWHLAAHPQGKMPV